MPPLCGNKQSNKYYILKTNIFFSVDPNMELSDHNGNEKAWLWTAFNDLSDDGMDLTVKEELFAIRFKTAESMFSY